MKKRGGATSSHGAESGGAVKSDGKVDIKVRCCCTISNYSVYISIKSFSTIFILGEAVG